MHVFLEKRLDLIAPNGPGSALHGSRHPVVCKWVNERPVAPEVETKVVNNL